MPKPTRIAISRDQWYVNYKDVEFCTSATFSGLRVALSAAELLVVITKRTPLSFIVGCRQNATVSAFSGDMKM